MKRKSPLLIGTVLIMLLLVRGTRFPAPFWESVLLWALSFFLVVTTLVVVRYPGNRGYRFVALVITVALVLVPPRPDSLLHWLPESMVALALLMYIYLIISLADESRGTTASSVRAIRGIRSREAMLSILFALVAFGPHILPLVLPGHVAAAVEWDGAWGPILAIVPLVLGLALVSSIWIVVESLKADSRQLKVQTGSQETSQGGRRPD